MNKLSQELNSSERERLATHETTVKAGLQTFYEVGSALLAIREGKLYRQDFATFEDYCHKRWGFVASRARQLIGAAEVVANLESVTDVTLSNEAQARVIAPLMPESQQAVWRFAVYTAPVVNGNPVISTPHIKKALHTVELLEQYGWKGDLQPDRALLIDPELRALLPLHEPYIWEQLERSLLEFGKPIAPLDVWGKTMLDGHARYLICMKHGLPFEVTQREFDSLSAAKIFILESQLLRKNYTPDEIAAITVDMETYQAASIGAASLDHCDKPAA
ncbi:MAG: hypothetical protein ACR2LC_14280 [Pyrinomonadaceae bacterium]